MKILVLADNFSPEIVATSFRTHEHAKSWIEAGHDVTVVTCAPNWPHGKVFDGYRNRLYQTEYLDGIRVIRVWSYMAANAGFLKRTLDYVSFMMVSILWCWRYPKFDVLLATSPQFFTAVAGWVISLIRWRPWIFEVRDLWPASIEAVGAGRGPMIRWLERVELFLYRRANRIVAVTDAIKRDMTQRGIAAEKIDVVTNAVDLHQFGPPRVTFDAREKLGYSADQFVVGYIGTTGMAHGLETIVTAAKLSEDDPSIQFVIIGDGAERKRIERLARERSVTNLRFADRIPHDQMPSYIDALDLPVVHLRPSPVFRTVIPSKMFEIMAMSQPVLMAVEGEAARIVNESKCGVCIPSGDPESMATAVRTAANHRQRLAELGRQGRMAVEQRYCRSVKALDALESLASACGQSIGTRIRQQSTRRAA